MIQREDSLNQTVDIRREAASTAASIPMRSLNSTDREIALTTNTGATPVLARVKCASQPAQHLVLITYILRGSSIMTTTNTLVCVVNRQAAWSVDGLTTVLMCSYVQSRRLSVTGMVETEFDDPGCSGSDQNGACSPVPDVKVTGRSRRKHGRLIRRH